MAFSKAANAVTQAVTGSSTGIAVGSIPAAGASAEGFVRAASVVELRSGEAPTSTKGNLWPPGSIIRLRSLEEIASFRVINATADAATIDWQFYTEVSAHGPGTLPAPADVFDASTKQAFVNATASGNTQVVAGVASKKVRVVFCYMSNGGASTINVNLQSASAAVTATKQLAASGGGFIAQPAQGFFCETVAGEALNVNLSGVGTVGVTVSYVEV